MSNCRKEKRMINAVILHSQNSLTQDSSAPQLQQVRVIPKQADNDQQLIALWLHGKSQHTQRYYKADTERFFKLADSTHKCN